MASRKEQNNNEYMINSIYAFGSFASFFKMFLIT